MQHSVTCVDRESNFLGRHLSIPFCLTSISRNDCWASPNDEDYRSDVFSAFESAALRRLRTRICRTWSGSLLFRLGLDKYTHNVALLHYQVLDTIDFDLGARPFAEQDAVADLDVNRDELAALVAAAGSLPCCGFSWAVSGMI